LEIVVVVVAVVVVVWWVELWWWVVLVVLVSVGVAGVGAAVLDTRQNLYLKKSAYINGDDDDDDDDDGCRGIPRESHYYSLSMYIYKNAQSSHKIPVLTGREL
jgi:hypothetical protein